MEAVESPKEPGLLERIRNMWEFANLAQWIFLFGKAVKIDEDIDIEVCVTFSHGDCVPVLLVWSLINHLQELEMECLKPHSTVLSDIGLALLKFVSSHRGLTYVTSWYYYSTYINKL